MYQVTIQHLCRLSTIVISPLLFFFTKVLYLRVVSKLNFFFKEIDILNSNSYANGIYVFTLRIKASQLNPTKKIIHSRETKDRRNIIREEMIKDERKKKEQR